MPTLGYNLYERLLQKTISETSGTKQMSNHVNRFQHMASSEETTQLADDFPAAHSMDVDFFAFDRDGNVARFSAWLDEYSPVPSALEIETSRAKLTSHIEGAIQSCLHDHGIDSELVTEDSNRQFLFHYTYQSGADGDSALFRAEDCSPESPELLRVKLENDDTASRHPADFPWLSFDDAPTLRWPPTRPATPCEREAVLDDAQKHWQDALKCLKTAERRQPKLVPFWQKIADRRYASLLALQQILDGSQEK